MEAEKNQDILFMEEEISMDLPDWADIMGDKQDPAAEGEKQGPSRGSQGNPSNTSLQQLSRGVAGTPRPNFRLRGGREESFKLLRKLIYKKHLAQHYEACIKKGIRENKRVIQLQKPDLNLVEYTKAPENFERRIKEILAGAEQKINEEVVIHYQQLTPKLEEEWDIALEECKTRFGPEATKEVVQRAKSVATDFLKKKLQTMESEGPEEPNQKRTRTPLREKQTPQRRNSRRDSMEDLLDFLKNLRK